ncbi:MAG: hypothetical protein QF819_09195 [Gemmatimonadota bacterium]|nr:hypothetical protein [Gemmatimonadota bacterium]
MSSTSFGATITVNSPSWSGSWTNGTPYYIEWTHSGTSGYFKIELYKGSTLVGEIIDNTYASTSPGYYYWTANNYLGGELTSLIRTPKQSVVNGSAG